MAATSTTSRLSRSFWASPPRLESMPTPSGPTGSELSCFRVSGKARSGPGTTVDRLTPPGAGTPGPEQRHCFRLGRPNKAVKATVYYGKSVLVRYVTAVRGVHRTRCAYNDRPELPPAPHATHTPKMPTVEWLEGEPSRFSPPTVFDVAVDLDSGAITQRPSPGRSLCAQCRSNPTLHKLSHCARCMKVSYCSKECQVAHWPLHKQECR